MGLLNKIFSKGRRFKVNGYKLKFMEAENAWYVFKGQNILFIGDEVTCRTYLDSL